MAAPKGNKYAIGNNGGAPTKYDPKYCEEIIDYFDIEPTREIEIPHFKGGEVAWTDKKVVANKLPAFHRFAKHINVDHTTLHEWCKVHKEFSQAYSYAKELQKYFLIENGLNGTYNPTAYVFTAKNITDMRDSQEITNTFGLKNLDKKHIDKLIDKL